MSDAPAPLPLMSLIDVAKANTAADFAAQLGGWCVVGPPLSLDDDDWNYRTLSARSVREEGPDGDILVLRDTYTAMPLKKSRPGPFADTILIGRASSNDVQIPHTSVSKLHARVRYDAEGRPSLSDAGSSNGTVLRDARVVEGTWVPLESGDVLTLGSCTFRVIDPVRLHALVVKFAR